MATSHKSAWENRFDALLQQIRFEREMIVHRIANNALDGDWSDEFIIEERHKVQIVDKLIKRGAEIRAMPINRLYVQE